MKTQLNTWHAENGGDMIDFAGFQMPVMYSSIKEEHLAVRNAAGLFDVSHMGRMWITGDDSEKFLNLLVPRDLSKTAVGRAAYTFMLNEQGGFRDDLVFERIEEHKWLLVWNAGNLEKIRQWMKTILMSIKHFSSINVLLEDISATSAMFALQGPKAEQILKQVLPVGEAPPSSWQIIQTTIDTCKVIISGTGYSGESGYEIIVLETTNNDPVKTETIWKKILSEGTQLGLKPCGLGARDSLRLEAGYHLYGNDLTESINPFEADLFFPPFIHMNKDIFIGKRKLEEYQKSKIQKIRIGLIAQKKGPSPRAGLALFKDNQEIGVITSGGFSPLLEIGVGMGYIEPEYNQEGNIIQFQTRKKLVDIAITKYPLFDQEKYGKTRTK
jgi:aminomethyltransferase